MMEQHLDFEQPIYTCLEKIEELKKIVPAPSNLAEEIALLEEKADMNHGLFMYTRSLNKFILK